MEICWLMSVNGGQREMFRLLTRRAKTLDLSGRLRSGLADAFARGNLTEHFQPANGSRFHNFPYFLSTARQPSPTRQLLATSVALH